MWCNHQKFCVLNLVSDPWKLCLYNFYISRILYIVIFIVRLKGCKTKVTTWSICCIKRWWKRDTIVLNRWKEDCGTAHRQMLYKVSISMDLTGALMARMVSIFLLFSEYCWIGKICWFGTFLFTRNYRTDHLIVLNVNNLFVNRSYRL